MCLKITHTLSHYQDTLNCSNSIITCKNVYEVITDLISMYTVSVLIKALMFSNSSSQHSQPLIG